MSYVLNGIKTAMVRDEDVVVCRPVLVDGVLTMPRVNPITCPCGWYNAHNDVEALRFHFTQCRFARLPESEDSVGSPRITEDE